MPLQICTNHVEKFKDASYCPVCSYEKENDLLKDNLELQRQEIIKLSTQKNMPDVAQPGATRELSFGEKAVGLTFNPGGDPKVDEIKRLYAQIIDLLDQNIEAEANTFKEDMLQHAILEAQSAQMWAVKVITWKN